MARQIPCSGTAGRVQRSRPIRELLHPEYVQLSLIMGQRFVHSSIMEKSGRFRHSTRANHLSSKDKMQIGFRQVEQWICTGTRAKEASGSNCFRRPQAVKRQRDRRRFKPHFSHLARNFDQKRPLQFAFIRPFRLNLDASAQNCLETPWRHSKRFYRLRRFASNSSSSPARPRLHHLLLLLYTLPYPLHIPASFDIFPISRIFDCIQHHSPFQRHTHYKWLFNLLNDKHPRL